MTALEIIGNVSNVAGALCTIIAAIGVIRMLATQRRQVEVVLVRMFDRQNDRMVTLPLELLRRDVSRAELLGRIGMLPMRQKGARFSIRFFSSPEFYRALNRVAQGESDIITILVTPDEVDQFEL